MTRLEQIAQSLSKEDSRALLAYAEFLSSRADTTKSRVSVSPLEIVPPPEGETVPAALKRLSAQYPMLDTVKLLDTASRLMGEHVMHGRPASEVIAELESLFHNHYQTLLLEERRGS